MLSSKMKSSKEKKFKGVQFKGPSTKGDKTNLPKEFKWMGFKSHMLATMAKWREVDFLTDAAFQCVDGRVSFHRLVVAAASPLLREAMSQDPNEETIISVPEIPSGVMAAMMDLLYKGRMYITPSNTWALRGLVEVLRINAEDVSVISGSRLSIPALPITPSLTPSLKMTEKEKPDNRGTRKRRRESVEETPPVAPKNAKIETPDNTPQRKPGRKKKKKNEEVTNNITNVAPTSSGFHDLEDVETWVCAICKCYDPVITSPIKNPKGTGQDQSTTEWIGCDCNRWYHQYCTKLKKIDDSFSCKQLNRKCLPM